VGYELNRSWLQSRIWKQQVHPDSVHLFNQTTPRQSVVGVVRYGLDDLEFEFQQRQETVLQNAQNRPIQWVKAGKRPVCEADQSPSSSAPVPIKYPSPKFVFMVISNFTKG
jgi:hypothetical protein